MNPQLVARCVNAAHDASQRGDFAAAVAWCKQALPAAADVPELWYHYGLALRGLGKREEALHALEQARIRTLGSADAQNNIGLAFIDAGGHAQAEQCLLLALKLAPGYAFAHSNLGKLRERQKRIAEAEAAFRKAIELQPRLAPAYANLGGSLNAQRRYLAAEAACRTAIEIDPRLPDAWNNLGRALAGQNRQKAAADSYARSLALDPKRDFISGHLLHCRMHLCDWTSFDDDLTRLLQAIGRGEKASYPFPILGLTTDPAIQRKAAEVYAGQEFPEQTDLGPLPKRSSHDRMRIGYFSADYYNHATAYLMAELLELHDKRRFELIAFSFGPDTQDEMRRRLASAFDRFIDVRDRSDRAVARLSRDAGIDIAVDLKGFTDGSRMGIFACRAAPIQVSYLGYPGTTGAGYIDYLIADKVLIPVESRRHYSEKVACLPHSYQVNDGKRPIADTVYTREALGLPATGFVFCCFNNSYKITPRSFDGWMRILHRVDGSVLWLFEAGPDAADNLRGEASRRGIDPARLIFGTRLPLADHLARLRAADLFIDTLPYNAHTTASDALWAGLPVLTCAGEAFASRVGASLLNAIGLPEQIASAQQEYEDLAVALALDPGRLSAIRERLARNRLTTPLFDTPRFARHLEAAYSIMHERHQAGLPPDHFDVAPQAG